MKLYVYDHCPFCVKARAIFGLKKMPFDLAILLNDDEATPTSMIGKKMAPILDDGGRYMAESMDIVAHVDAMAGEAVLTGPCNPQVAQWMSEATSVLYLLALPRWAASDFAEFSTSAARVTFTRNKEAMIGSFKDRLAESGDHIATLNRLLPALDAMIQSPEAVNGELSQDDIHLFATLRAMSIVKGIAYPPQVDAYRRRMAERMAIDLHDGVAI